MADDDEARSVAAGQAAERVQASIIAMRGVRVMMDSDLAALYGVPTKVLLQAARRNLRRFPPDFMFQLTVSEARSRSQIVTLNAQGLETTAEDGRPASSRGRNIKHRPHAFTEQRIAMHSSVLRSQRAIDVNIEIMRAFVRLRQVLESHSDLARKLDALESKYRKHDAQFRLVFDTIRELMAAEDATDKPRIGFGREDAGGAPRK